MTEQTASQIVGARIRTRRLELGTSQDVVAKLAGGMNVSNFGKLERGLANPTLHTLVRVAAVLQMDPGDLLARIGPESLPPAKATFTVADFIEAKRAAGAEG